MTAVGDSRMNFQSDSSPDVSDSWSTTRELEFNFLCRSNLRVSNSFKRGTQLNLNE